MYSAKRSGDDQNSSRTPSPSLTMHERKRLFYDYASHYADRFRCGIDFQYAEEPRQIVGLIILVMVTGLFGFYWESISRRDTISAQKSAHAALAGIFFTLLVYCFLQTRDGLLVRPHPGIWRLVHACGLFHLLICTGFAVVPQEVGRQFVRLILPGVRSEQRSDGLSMSDLPVDVFAGTVDLRCELSMETLRIQLGKMWFYAHIVGWFAKMCIFRDWSFCLVLSIAFETVELSFQWLIPELRECWWDSLFLDVLLSNTLGMVAGYLLLRAFRSVTYNWLDLSPSVKEAENASASQLANREYEGREHCECTTEGNAKDAGHLLDKDTRSRGSFKTTELRYLTTDVAVVLRRYTTRLFPFLWSNYHWRFFRTPERLCQATFLLIAALSSELNVFLMMYALDIPASHIYHKLRVTCLCFLAISGVAETYNYVNQEGQPLQACSGGRKLRRRIGHNAWLYVTVLAVETLVVFRYGRARFRRILPDASIIIPWTLSFGCLGIWCFFHFIVVGAERLDFSRATWDAILTHVNRLATSTNLPKAMFPETKSNEENGHDDGPRRRRTAGMQNEPGLIDSQDEELIDATLERVCFRLAQRKLYWKLLWTVGMNVVSLPPVLCFLPLLVLFLNYDYD